MGTQDSTFFAVGSSNPNDFTGFTAWSTPSGNISFDQGVLGIGVKRGLIGLVVTGTNAPAKLPPAVGYTAKVATFGGANTDTGAAGVSTTLVGVFGQCGAAPKDLSADLSCGVLGASAGKPGVIGWSSKSVGVQGFSTDDLGVFGVTTNGTGVVGSATQKGTGMWGSSSDPSFGVGVIGSALSGGIGV
jgi:hypothetical protein